MTGLLMLSALGPDALIWLAAVLAGATGLALHVYHPPGDADVAEAMLMAALHP